MVIALKDLDPNHQRFIFAGDIAVPFNYVIQPLCSIFTANSKVSNAKSCMIQNDVPFFGLMNS